MLLNAVCWEGRGAAAPTHPPTAGLATAEPLRLRSARAALARREGVHLLILWRARLVGATRSPSIFAWGLPRRAGRLVGRYKVALKATVIFFFFFLR